MAENKTVEERLAEIEAERKAKEKAAKERAAKQKAARDKAEAEQKKRADEAVRVAKENSEKRGAPITEKRLNPQNEAGYNAGQDQRVERENKTNLSNKYGQAYRKREDLLESYRKTGDSKYRQLILDADANLKIVVSDYVKVFGTEPPGYRPVPTLSKTTGRSEGQQRQGVKGPFPTAGQTESREVARSAGRNGTPSAAASVVAQSSDPYIQSIIDAAAKAGIQLSLADATAAAGGGGGGGGGGGYGSLASTRSQTTQYTMQQVRSAADSIYQNSIGRALNDDELRMLHQSLNNTLKSSPTVTKTDAKGNTTTTGGLDERGFMQQQAETNPEFASYQKATTYFDAMLSTLQGPVGGGI